MSRGASLMLAAAATFLIVVAGESHSASACSCVGFTDTEAFDAADTVFTGTLAEIMTPPGDTFSSTEPERFVFDVDEVYKGEAFVRQTIVTAREGGSCGLEITGRGPFLVFARTTDSIVSGAAEGELYSNLCSGTRATISDAVPLAFGAGQSPTQLATAEDGASMGDATPRRDGGDGSFPYWVLPTIEVVSIGVAGVVLTRRRP